MRRTVIPCEVVPKLLSGEDRNGTSATNTGKTALSESGGAESGANRDTTDADAQLQTLKSAWPSLPSSIRSQIVAKVRQVWEDDNI